MKCLIEYYYVKWPSYGTQFRDNRDNVVHYCDIGILIITQLYM